MFIIPSSPSTGRNTNIGDSRDDRRVLDGSKRPDEGCGLEIFVQLNKAELMFHRLVDHGHAEIVGELGRERM